MRFSLRASRRFPGAARLSTAVRSRRELANRTGRPSCRHTPASAEDARCTDQWGASRTESSRASRGIGLMRSNRRRSLVCGRPSAGLITTWPGRRVWVIPDGVHGLGFGSSSRSSDAKHPQPDRAIHGYAPWAPRVSVGNLALRAPFSPVKVRRIRGGLDIPHRPAVVPRPRGRGASARGLAGLAVDGAMATTLACAHARRLPAIDRSCPTPFGVFGGTAPTSSAGVPGERTVPA